MSIFVCLGSDKGLKLQIMLLGTHALHLKQHSKLKLRTNLALGLVSIAETMKAHKANLYLGHHLVVTKQ